MVQCGGRTGLDALATIAQQSAIIEMQGSGIFQIYAVTSIAVDARIIDVDYATISSRQTSGPVVPNFSAVNGQVRIGPHVNAVMAVAVDHVLR